MDPLTKGDYPLSMRTLVGNRLPRFTKEQSKAIYGSFDFIGLNYYTARYVQNTKHSNNGNKSYSTDSQTNQSGNHVISILYSNYLGGLRVFWTCIVTTVERNGTAIGPKV
jgi:beta-glucosidase/6-phospho-beta-glucosidase/beta-galactosidase